MPKNAGLTVPHTTSCDLRTKVRLVGLRRDVSEVQEGPLGTFEILIVVLAFRLLQVYDSCVLGMLVGLLQSFFLRSPAW